MGRERAGRRVGATCQPGAARGGYHAAPAAREDRGAAGYHPHRAAEVTMPAETLPHGSDADDVVSTRSGSCVRYDLRVARLLQALFGGPALGVPVYAPPRGPGARGAYHPERIPCADCPPGPNEWRVVRHVAERARALREGGAGDAAVQRERRRVREQHALAPDSLESYCVHVWGARYRGTYSLVPGDPPTTRLIAHDLDDHDEGRDLRPHARAVALAGSVARLGYDRALLLNTSRGGVGRHVRLCVDPTTPAWLARRIGEALLEHAGIAPRPDPGTPEHAVWLERFGEDPAGGVEVFPRQDRLSGRHLGNLLALPCSEPLMREGRAALLAPPTWDRAVTDLAEAADLLARVQPLGPADVAHLARALGVDLDREQTRQRQRRARTQQRRAEQVLGRTRERGEDPSAEEALLRDALQWVSSDDYDTWVRFGLALRHWDEARGRAAWDAWSASSAKFDPAAQDRTWESLEPRGDVTLGSIYHEAVQWGWQRPAPEPRTPARHEPRRPRVEHVTDAQLRTFVRSAVRREGGTPVAAVCAVAAGLGKTERTLAEIVQALPDHAAPGGAGEGGRRRGPQLAIAAPNHDLAEEILERLHEQAERDGREIRAAKTPRLACPAGQLAGETWRPDALQRLWSDGYDAARLVCAGPRPCPIRNECPWRIGSEEAARADLAVLQHARCQGASVWTGVARHADPVVIEEDPTGVLAGHVELRPSDMRRLREALDTLRLGAASRALGAEARRDVGGVHDAAAVDDGVAYAQAVVDQLGVALRRTGEEVVEIGLPDVDDDTWGRLRELWHGLVRERVGPRRRAPPNLPLILDALRRAARPLVLRDAADEDAGATLWVPTRASVPPDRTVLLLDATADDAEARALLGTGGRPVTVLRGGADRAVAVAQVTDSPWGRRRLRTPEGRAHAVRLVRRILARHPEAERVGLVTYRALLDSDFVAEVGDPRVEPMHFGALRGRDGLEGIGLLVVLGSALPPRIAVQRRAVLHGATPEELRESGTWTWVEREGRPLLALSYGSPAMEAAHRALVHGELTQAVGRLSRGPAAQGLAYLLSGEPLDLPYPTWTATERELGLDQEPAAWERIRAAVRGGASRRDLATGLALDERAARRLVAAAGLVARIEAETAGDTHDRASADDPDKSTAMEVVPGGPIVHDAAQRAPSSDSRAAAADADADAGLPALLGRCQAAGLSLSLLADLLPSRPDTSTLRRYARGARSTPPGLPAEVRAVLRWWAPDGGPWLVRLRGGPPGPPRVVETVASPAALSARLEQERRRRHPRAVRVEAEDGRVERVDASLYDVHHGWPRDAPPPEVLLAGDAAPAGRRGWYRWSAADGAWAYVRPADRLHLDDPDGAPYGEAQALLALTEDEAPGPAGLYRPAPDGYVLERAETPDQVAARRESELLSVRLGLAAILQQAHEAHGLEPGPERDRQLARLRGAASARLEETRRVLDAGVPAQGHGPVVEAQVRALEDMLGAPPGDAA